MLLRFVFLFPENCYLGQCSYKKYTLICWHFFKWLIAVLKIKFSPCTRRLNNSIFKWRMLRRTTFTTVDGSALGISVLNLVTTTSSPHHLNLKGLHFHRIQWFHFLNVEAEYFMTCLTWRSQLLVPIRTGENLWKKCGFCDEDLPLSLQTLMITVSPTSVAGYLKNLFCDVLMSDEGVPAGSSNVDIGGTEWHSKLT